MQNTVQQSFSFSVKQQSRTLNSAKRAFKARASSLRGQFKDLKVSVMLGRQVSALEGFKEDIVSPVLHPQTGRSLHMAKLARHART